MPQIEYLNRTNPEQKRPGLTQGSSTSPDPTIVTGLVGTSIKTSLVKLSAKVVNDSGELLQHIALKQVVDWTTYGKVLYINSVDAPVPLTLEFISKSEAEIGEDRFHQLINGATLL